MHARTQKPRESVHSSADHPAAILLGARRRKLRTMRTHWNGLVTCGVVAVVATTFSACSADFSPPEPVSSSDQSTVAPPASAPRVVTSDVPQLSGMEALLTGTLEVDEDGCVRAWTTENSVSLVWPQGYTVRGESASFEVLDAGGRVVARSGTPIAMGGGGVDTANEAWRETDCATGTLWLVGDF